MPITMTGKLIRISADAHRAAKVAAAINDETMEEWCSRVLLDEAQRVRYAPSARTVKSRARRR